MATKRKVAPKPTGKVSKILYSNKIEAASVAPKAKSISVFDGWKNTYIPNTPENRKKLTEKFGKPRVSKYRGKERKVWLDSSIY